MSVFIDRKFLKLLSPKLNRFTQKKEDLFNFRCPFCGDSQKNQFKARGYVFRKKNQYFYKCQNCGVGHTMYNFINLLDPNMAKEYSLERYANGDTAKTYEKPEFKFEEFLHKVKLRPGMIHLCGSVELYLEMIEEIYNHHRRTQDKLNLRF